MSQTRVTYLGFILTEGQRSLPQERSNLQLRGFLGMAGFCRIWIPNYDLIPRPPNETLKGKDDDPFE